MTLADMLDKLERGRIGHSEAMTWLGVESINDLVAIVHANGRQMPGHRATPLTPETREILRLAVKKPQISDQLAQGSPISSENRG